MMKRVYLYTILLLTVSRGCCVHFGNSTTLSTLSITAPPPEVTLPIDQSYWNQTSVSLLASKHFHGPGINASLSSYCVASQLAFYSSAYRDFMQHNTVPPPQIQTYTLESPAEVKTATYPFQFYTSLSYSPPCCGYCTVWAANAKVFYWPTPNPHPGVTIATDSTGFTYTSPTVYIRYSTLQAGDFCQTGVEPNIGVGINITTLEFQPTELSTLRKATNMDANIGTYQVDFRDWGTECTSSLPLSTATDSEGIVGQWAPCYAILAIPTKVLDLQPEWSTCVNGKGVTGVHDPPYALTPVAGAAFTPPPTPSPGSSTIPPATSPSLVQGPSSTRAMFAPSTVTAMEPSRTSITVQATKTADPPSSQPGDPAPLSTVDPPAVEPVDPALESTADPTTVVRASQGQSHLVSSTTTMEQVSKAPVVPSGGTIPAPEAPGSVPSRGDATSIAPAGASEIVVVAGTTLTPGGAAATVSGTPISLDPSGVIMVGTSTLVAAHATAAAFAIGSVTVAVHTSDIVVGGATLLPGAPAVTVDGMPVSLGTGVLVVGTRTETFSPDSASPTDGLGALIMSGLGAVGGNTVTPNSLTPTIRLFEGQGSRNARPPLVLSAFVIYMVWFLR